MKNRETERRETMLRRGVSFARRPEDSYQEYMERFLRLTDRVEEDTLIYGAK